MLRESAIILSPTLPQRILITVLLVQLTVVLGLLVYLAACDKALVLEVVPRTAIRQFDVSKKLIIPVAGVRAAELTDTYGAPRSGGRSHKGIDIFAPVGTPVLATANGVVVGLDSSALGGLSLYQRDLDGRTIYYYAHLQRYREGLKVGDLVRQGEVIAYVGETGNVIAGGAHLHFAVHTVTDPNRWGQGRDLNPCPLLSCGQAEREAAPAPEA